MLIEKCTFLSPTAGVSTVLETSTVPSTKIFTFSEDLAVAEGAADKNNLETFLIVWLNANVSKTQDNLDTLTELRASVNYIKTFDDLQECEAYIRNFKREKIIFIVEGGFGHEFVLRTHDLSQLNCIYVYCLNKVSNEA